MKKLLARKNAKRILLGVLLLLSLGAVTGITLTLCKKPTDDLANGAVVYESGGAVFAFLNGETIKIENNSADRFLYDEAGKRLFYTVASSYSSGTFDLYYLSAASEKPMLVDYGINGDFYLGRNGETVYYIKRSDKSGNLEGICFDAASRQMITFAQNPEALFVPKSAAEIYFTRRHGSTAVLYAYTPGTKPKELFRDAEELRLFDGDRPELLFQSGTGTANISLQIVYQGEMPLLISDGVKQVLWEDYAAGGNLYYCTACQNGLSWRAVISDTLAAEDEVLTEPVRGDYISVFGYHLGYPTAKAAYDRKVKRDEVRAALDAAFADAIGSCDAYAYQRGGSVLLAENIRINAVKATAPTGEPKLVFGVVTATETPLDITDLTTLTAESGVQAAVAYATEAANNKTENNGLKMALLYQGAVSSYGLQGYPQEAAFRFSRDGKSLLALTEKGNSDTLFCGSVTEQQPASGQEISNGITDACFTDNGAVFMKTADGASGTVYRWNGTEIEALSENSYAFLVKGGVYVFKNYASAANGEQTTADYFYCSGGREKAVGKAVAVNSVTAGESDRIAFLSEGGLILCCGENTVKISNQATNILYIH